MVMIKEDNVFAFDCLFQKYHYRIYRFAYLILKVREDAENIVQDVFLNLWINRNRIERDVSVRYYLFTSAHNSSISLLRVRLKEEKFLEKLKLLQKENYESPDYEDTTELEKRIYKIVETLPERQKEVYILHGKEGMKYAEISKRLNISEKTVENHISRALKYIRKKMNIIQSVFL